MAKGLMEEGWDSFREAVLTPLEAPDAMVGAMQTAFYSGASFLMAQVLLRLEQGEDPTEEDLAMMDGIHAELVAFSKSKMGG